jgi:phosphoglucomutase/phosphomannomutase
MVKIVETITNVNVTPYSEALTSGMIRPVAEGDRRAYVKLNLSLRLRDRPGPAKFVFTPLHGTGANTVGACLQAMGYDEGRQFFIVESQREFRGDFANVKFRTPNPEVPESLDSAIELAKKVQADLVLATDPDADRIGGAVPWQGDYVFVNGNEFATILTRYRLESLRRAGKLPTKAVILKTQVTTELMTYIGRAYGARVIGDLLVGFKYVGDILDHLERDGRFGDVVAGIADFVVAAEESHGLLVTTEIHDKDAAGAAVVLAELASEMKEQGSSIYAYLVDTYKCYGYHRNFLRSTIMQGAAGTAAIGRIQDELRREPPREIGGRKVESVTDYWDTGAFGPVKSETDRSSRNLLTFFLEGGVKTTIRPSGTEPKNKVYIEKRSEPVGANAPDEQFEQLRRAVDDEVEQFSNDFMKKMLGIIGVELPNYSLQISDLVALERKQHFSEKFLPAFEERARAALKSEAGKKDLGPWIDTELRSYGPDARLLVAKGFRTYLASQREKAPDKELLLALQEEVFFGG